MVLLSSWSLGLPVSEGALLTQHLREGVVDILEALLKFTRTLQLTTGQSNSTVPVVNGKDPTVGDIPELLVPGAAGERGGALLTQHLRAGVVDILEALLKFTRTLQLTTGQSLMGKDTSFSFSLWNGSVSGPPSFGGIKL